MSRDSISTHFRAQRLRAQERERQIKREEILDANGQIIDFDFNGNGKMDSKEFSVKKEYYRMQVSLKKSSESFSKYEQKMQAKIAELQKQIEEGKDVKSYLFFTKTVAEIKKELVDLKAELEFERTKFNSEKELITTNQQILLETAQSELGKEKQIKENIDQRALKSGVTSLYIKPSEDKSLFPVTDMEGFRNAWNARIQDTSIPLPRPAASVSQNVISTPSENSSETPSTENKYPDEVTAPEPIPGEIIAADGVAYNLKDLIVLPQETDNVNLQPMTKDEVESFVASIDTSVTFGDDTFADKEDFIQALTRVCDDTEINEMQNAILSDLYDSLLKYKDNPDAQENINMIYEYNKFLNRNGLLTESEKTATDEQPESNTSTSKASIREHVDTVAIGLERGLAAIASKLAKKAADERTPKNAAPAQVSDGTATPAQAEESIQAPAAKLAKPAPVAEPAAPVETPVETSAPVVETPDATAPVAETASVEAPATDKKNEPTEQNVGTKEQQELVLLKSFAASLSQQYAHLNTRDNGFFSTVADYWQSAFSGRMDSAQIMALKSVNQSGLTKLHQALKEGNIEYAKRYWSSVTNGGKLSLETFEDMQKAGEEYLPIANAKAKYDAAIKARKAVQWYESLVNAYKGQSYSRDSYKRVATETIWETFGRISGKTEDMLATEIDEYTTWTREQKTEYKLTQLRAMYENGQIRKLDNNFSRLGGEQGYQKAKEAFMKATKTVYGDNELAKLIAENTHYTEVYLQGLKIASTALVTIATAGAGSYVAGLGAVAKLGTTAQVLTGAAVDATIATGANVTFNGIELGTNAEGSGNFLGLAPNEARTIGKDAAITAATTFTLSAAVRGFQVAAKGANATKPQASEAGNQPVKTSPLEPSVAASKQPAPQPAQSPAQPVPAVQETTPAVSGSGKTDVAEGFMRFSFKGQSGMHERVIFTNARGEKIILSMKDYKHFGPNVLYSKTQIMGTGTDKCVCISKGSNRVDIINLYALEEQITRNLGEKYLQGLYSMKPEGWMNYALATLTKEQADDFTKLIIAKYKGTDISNQLTELISKLSSEQANAVNEYLQTANYTVIKAAL